MKILVHRIDRAYWRRRPYARKFCGGYALFLTFFQIYFWWRAPTNEEPHYGAPDSLRRPG